MKNKKIEYGKNDVFTEEDFEDKNVKVRITTHIDMDVLKALKKESKMTGEGYQTILNRRLRDSLFGDKVVTIQEINKRVKKLEKLLKV